MIVMVVGDDDTRRGPIPMALALGGFETRDTRSTDEADRNVGLHGAEQCVLVFGGVSLAAKAGMETWTSFLRRHPGVAAVVVTRGDVDAETRKMANPPHRILCECPFDAAAVVAAVRRVASSRRARGRRAPPAHLSEAG